VNIQDLYSVVISER